ncbi:LysR substrate-binding domain-containing protein [Cognaticolwellia beringensis]|uniref:LysR family transcriptional regulator n=1 Tax=Cognaticolwellia beringensis TaxID=1967665 RepID=A0A222G6X6_9GAMM|nr:LysR substrate-binding domain-containing protein [Cognaticolwellia beringensis]ASP47647.1 LysR family transcriptional regulator [Cognaticolwellia beringensis]
MNGTPLTFEALLVLDAIANRGSFASAAEQLNKVPSAVSYIVQKLEEQLSVTLFVRQGRRSVLTPAGQHLLHEGRKILAAVSKVTEQTQTLAHGWEPKIRIAFDSINAVAPIMQCLQSFLIEHPNVEVDLCEQVLNGSWEALIEDKVDLLIGAPPPVPNQAGIRALKICQFENVLVAAKQHELSHFTRPITHRDIADYRTVVVHDSSKSTVPWSSNVVDQSRHFYVVSVEHKIHAIAAGIGVGFLPKARVQHLVASGQLVTLKTENEQPSVDLFLAWKTVNKGKGLARLRALLLEHYA